MGDQCLYFRLGHQRYFEAVAEKDVYKINPRDKPWERTHVYECELVKVVGIKYVIKPPRVVCLRLACSLGPPDAGGGGPGPGGGAAGPSARGAQRALNVRYHDMPDVIDFLVLRQQYDAAVSRRWGAGDRFRCMIDDCWWTGEVLERAGAPGAGASALAAECGAAEWAAAAAAHFLALKVRWDNGEVERLSPWDLEPLDAARLPAAPGGAVAVLARELDAVLYRAEPHEWDGDRATACRAIAEHIGSVMSLAVAEPFVAPVDLAQYPAYARVVPYPVDLATIRARCSSLFYRRAAAAQFDARYLASNAERFNEPHAPIVRQARLVTDLLLRIIAAWRQCDVLAAYHELADSYRSSDDEVRARGGWRAAGSRALAALWSSADAEPFRAPVLPDLAPDYQLVVSRPMDLGQVRERLARGEYASAEQFVADVRQVFTNSRLYNTNKRSRIYSMTVRLSALFEALWARHAGGARGAARGRRPRRAARGNKEVQNGAYSAAHSHSDSSDSETLAATSRRVHAAERAAALGSGPAARGAPPADPHDSWDSDAPLRVHSKGKGVGKKSKSSGTSASAEPVAGTSRGTAHETRGSWSRSSSCSNVEALEAQLSCSDSDAQRPPSRRARRARKRRRGSSASSGRRARHTARNKRTRERASLCSSPGSSSRTSWSGGSSLRRYESDRSYRPRDSTDDDRPLQLYRERPRGTHHSSHTGGVSLRARRARRQYNEDSEEDSVAAISKRLQHHARAHHAHLATRRRHHAAQSASAEASSHRADHDYFNGHAHAHAHAHAPPAPAHAHATHNGGSSSSAEGAGRLPAAVSISSRGRLRKLTPKARGLLRD